MIVAIDGHAGAGKTTVSSLVAERLNYPILQSGLIYRALGWEPPRFVHQSIIVGPVLMART